MYPKSSGKTIWSRIRATLRVTPGFPSSWPPPPRPSCHSEPGTGPGTTRHTGTVKAELTYEGGEPLSFDGDPDDDDEVMAEKVLVVRTHIQSMLRVGLKERRHIFW